jgi:hypothetical protein
MGSSDRGSRLRWAKEKVDDGYKSASLVGNAPPRRSTSSLADASVSQSLLVLVLVGAVPVVAMMQDGAGIFATRPYAPVLWAGLAILAILAVTAQFGYIVRWRPSNGSPLLLALPLVQASIFLASQRLFLLRHGRGTVCFAAAKNERDHAGRVRWNDLVYWVVIGYLGAALSLLVAFRSGLRLTNLW